MPNVYQTVFGGSLVAPAIPTYLSLPISANVILGWPLESNITSPAAAEIIDVTASVGALTIQLSDARQVGTGYCALFNNVGANTFSVLDAQGNTLMALASGQAWQLYLADNSTLQGTWRVFQYGAGVSNANAASLAGNGLKAIATTLNERIVINSQATNYAILTADRAACVEWTGGSGGTFTAPAAAAVGSDWFCYIKNAGTGVLTLSGTIDGSAGKSFNPNDSCILVSDGTNLFTLGFGQSVASSFNFVTISLAGATGTVILTGAQLNRISYKFTGALAGNVVVQVPASIQQYWIDNETTGAFTLTISAGGAGTTVVVPQATRTILYCDGLNIVNAVSSGAIQFADGTAAAPSITFASDTTVGFYKAGSGALGISTAGVSRGIINATGQWNIPATTAAGGITLTVAPFPGQPAININAPAGSGPILNMLINSVSNMNLAVAATINQGVSGTGVGDTYLVTSGGAFVVSTNGGTSVCFRVNQFGQTQITNGTAFGAGLAATTQIIMQAGGSNVPQITLVCANAVANQRIYDIFNDSSGTLHCRVVNDAYGAANDWMQVTRSGATPLALLGWGPVAAALVDMTPDTGTFTGVLTGMTATINITCTWMRVGKLCLLNLGANTGTSNTASMSMTGLPAAIQPATLGRQSVLMDSNVLTDSSATLAVSNKQADALIQNGSGTITFRVNGSSVLWTNSGNKGISDAITIAYLLT